jgi:hypothetical protein
MRLLTHSSRQGDVRVLMRPGFNRDDIPDIPCRLIIHEGRRAQSGRQCCHRWLQLRFRSGMFLLEIGDSDSPREVIVRWQSIGSGRRRIKHRLAKPFIGIRQPPPTFPGHHCKFDGVLRQRPGG